jgi:glyoxylase I family protein
MIDQASTEIAAVFRVGKLDRTLAFYRDVLGITIDRHDDGHAGAYGMGRIGSAWFIFFEEPDVKPGTSPILVFSVKSDIRETVDALVRQGVEIVAPVSEAPGGLSADFLDPDGHVLSLYQADQADQAADPGSTQAPG